ncbi:hypothetical protein ACFY8O_25690 [Streptomyces argenteolus]|uniref:Uncharacterized protein n=1 Tax=Streptomyces argenteolus TaxID=67274 RepID=A0ABW6XC35_9ACTN
MEDLLLTLAVPAVVLAGGVYAVCDCRRQRRRPPSPYTRRAAELAARDAVDRAVTVVEDAYTALGGLYADPATPYPAGPAAVSGGAGSSPDHDPSRPAPVRRP